MKASLSSEFRSDNLWILPYQENAMNRRSFLKTTAAASLAAAIESNAAPKAAPSRPNVLYLFSDQHRAASMPGEPYSQVIAPNLDAFRRQNVSMDACISNYPLCSPHRAILMSGQYPAETGVESLGPALPTETVSLGETFRSNGYHTGYVGKWHLAGNGERGFIPKGPRRFGFEDWHVWDVTNNHYHAWTYDQDTGQKIQPEGYQPTLMTDEAIEFLHKQPADKPWLLIVSWNPPHPPFDPPEKDQEPYPLETLKSRPNVKLAQPGIDLGPHRKPLSSTDALRQAQRGYYGGITAIDLEFARILKTLEETGQAENTIVIYTSDHGEMMGSHGHMAKQMPHEESCRVPFFIRTPGANPKSHSSKVLFSSIDIYPSLCGLAGIAVPSHCRGRDLSPALRGGSTTSPEYAFLTNERKPNSPEQFTPTYRGLRTATHTYAVMESGRWCLYDNVADPFQEKNLIKDPSQAPLIAKFDAAVTKWMAMTGDKFPYENALKSYSDYPDYPEAATLQPGHETEATAG